MFGVNDILIVMHMCGSYGYKSSMQKINVIQKMKEYANTTEVRRSLDVCMFYHIWVPDFVDVANVLLVENLTKVSMERRTI